MAFSPRNIVGCLLKKRLTKGGHGHPRTPLATPLRITIAKKLKEWKILKVGGSPKILLLPSLFLKLIYLIELKNN